MFVTINVDEFHRMMNQALEDYQKCSLQTEVKDICAKGERLVTLLQVMRILDLPEEKKNEYQLRANGVCEVINMKINKIL